MENRLRKSLAILGVTLFATSALAVSVQKATTTTAHADSIINQKVAINTKKGAFLAGFKNETFEANNSKQESLLKYYNAGIATRKGIYDFLAVHEINAKDKNQREIDLAIKTAQVGSLSDQTDKKVNSLTEKSSVDDFVSAYAHDISHEYSRQNTAYKKDKIFKKAFIDGTQKKYKLVEFKGLNPKATDAQIQAYKDGYTAGKEASWAVNDAKHNHTPNPKYLTDFGYASALIGYTKGYFYVQIQDGDAHIDKMSTPYQYGYYAGVETAATKITKDATKDATKDFKKHRLQTFKQLKSHVKGYRQQYELTAYELASKSRPQLVQVKSTIALHKHSTFGDHDQIRYFHKGDVVRVKKVVINEYNRLRYVIADHPTAYITANPDFVNLIK